MSRSLSSERDENHEREEGEERQQSRHRDSRDGERNGAGLHIKNLHPRTSEEDLTEALAKFGQISSCAVIRDPHTQESRGFGFVTMSTPEEADDVIRQLDNTSLDGRTISIQKSRRTEPRQPTPGSYRGLKSQDELRRRDGEHGRFPPVRQDYPAPYLDDRFRGQPPPRYPPSGYAYPPHPTREIPRIDRYIDQRGRNDSRAYDREPPRSYGSSYDTRDRVDTRADARSYDSRDRVDTRADARSYDSRDRVDSNSRGYDREREPRAYDRGNERR